MPYYIEVVFPLPFRRTFTYSVPEIFVDDIEIGRRVIAPFAKKTLTGFIVKVISESPQIKDNKIKSGDSEIKIKEIYDVLDKKSVFSESTLRFYSWLADYYFCSLGEALRLIVPVGTSVVSKKMISSSSLECVQALHKEKNKGSIRAKILHFLIDNSQVSISTLQRVVNKKNIYSSLRTMEKEGLVSIIEETDTPKIKEKKVKAIKLAKDIEEIYELLPEIERKSPQHVPIILKLISLNKEEVELSPFLKENSFSPSSINTLVKKGIISYYLKDVVTSYSQNYTEKQVEFLLTDRQKSVIDEVKTSLEPIAFKPYLLHGVTASGKTQVYIELIKDVLSKNRSALVLVPEISLTPQITSRLINNFGDIVTVMHSKMTLRERYDSWLNTLRGKSRVIIGARSALFVPINDLGIIIVDEEHDSSYKQTDLPPKYNARDSAIMRAKMANCPVLLGSATPSIESMHNAETGKFKLLALPERVDNSKLPVITLVDLIEEKRKKMMENNFSKTLLEKIDSRLKKKEGTIILQNRRGFSTNLYCTECGEIEMCTNCSVSLVFHINQNKLKCHYCGLVKDIPNECSHCKSRNLKYFGSGTERIEDELLYYFPKAVIERIDSDSISKRGKLGETLINFRNGEIDILVGTQMVSKGLDFSRVTLVGVISAETSLWMPDFRADERTFQLLTQVAGRSGRSKDIGEVLIQTQNKKHFVLQRVLMNDYEGFYKKEILDRERMNYPPFSRLCVIEMKDKDEEKVKTAITHLYKLLYRYKNHFSVSEPTTAVIARLRGEYRFQILLKSLKSSDPSGTILRKALDNCIGEYNCSSKHRDVRIFVDIDPQNIA